MDCIDCKINLEKITSFASLQLPCSHFICIKCLQNRHQKQQSIQGRTEDQSNTLQNKLNQQGSHYQYQQLQQRANSLELGQIDLRDVVCTKCTSKRPSINSKRSSHKMNIATYEIGDQMSQNVDSHKQQRTNSLKGNQANINFMSPQYQKQKNNNTSPVSKNQLVSGPISDRDLNNKKQLTKYNNFIETTNKKATISTGISQNKKVSGNQEFRQDLITSKEKLSPDNKINNIMLQNSNFIPNNGNFQQNDVNSIQSPLSFISQQNTSPNQINQSKENFNQNITQQTVHQQRIGNNQNSSNTINSCSTMNNFSTQQQSHLSHVNNSQGGTFSSIGVNSSQILNVANGKTGQASTILKKQSMAQQKQQSASIRKQSLTNNKNQTENSTGNQFQTQKDRIQGQQISSINPQSREILSFSNQPCQGGEIISNQQEAYFQNAQNDSYTNNYDRIQGKIMNKKQYTKDNGFDETQHQNQKDQQIQSQLRKLDPQVEQQYNQQSVNSNQTSSTNFQKKNLFNYNVSKENFSKDKELSGESKLQTTATFKKSHNIYNNPHTNQNNSNEQMSSHNIINLHQQNQPKGAQTSTSQSGVDHNINHQNLHADQSNSRSPQISKNLRKNRNGQNEIKQENRRNKKVNATTDSSQQKLKLKTPNSMYAGNYDVSGDSGYTQEQINSIIQNNEEHIEYFPPVDTFIHHLQSPNNYNNIHVQDLQSLQQINKQYYSSVLEQDPYQEINQNQENIIHPNQEIIMNKNIDKDEHQLPRQNLTPTSAFLQYQQLAQQQNQLQQNYSSQPLSKGMKPQTSSDQIQSIQNLKKSLKISINQANINKINEGTGNINSGISTNLYQIQEKDSQQNTQRQQSIDQHFLQNLNWSNIELIQKTYADFKNGEQIKCQIHQDIISLYCEKDKNLLCVSCVFESEEHFKHTVIPLKVALPAIMSKTNTNRTLLRDKVLIIEEDLQKCITNRSMIERSFEKTLDTLNKEFQNLKNLINQKQKQLEDQIIKSFESSLFKYDTLIQDLKEIKTCVIESNKHNPIPSNQNNIDLLIKDHFIFDTLVQTLKQVKVSIFDVKKQDLEILAIKYKQDIKNCIEEYGNIRFLHDHHIGIKRLDNTSYQSIVNSHMNSPQNKQKNASSKSSARDTTNSISPTRYNYVQRTLQAHFSSQRQHVGERKANLKNKILQAGNNYPSNKQSQYSSVNEATSQSNPLNTKDSALHYSNIQQNANSSNIHQVNQSNTNNSNINTSNLINNINTSNIGINNITALSYKNSILNQSQNQIQSISQPNLNIPTVQDTQNQTPNNPNQFIANSYYLQHQKQKQNTVIQKQQNQQQQQQQQQPQNIQHQIPLTERGHTRTQKNDKNTATSVFLQNKRFRQQQGQSTSIN